MKPLDFEVWSTYFPSEAPVPRILDREALALRLEVVEFYYNYLRLRERITSLEEELAAANGKIYALQETIDGRG